MTNDPANPDCQLADLRPVDVFLVNAFRKWTLGLREGNVEAWVVVWEGFTELVGPGHAPVAAERFEALMQALGHNARRTIHFHSPGCPCVDADETALIELLCAAESENAAGARSRAMAFVEPEGIDALLTCARQLALTLKVCGCPPAGVGGRSRPAAGWHGEDRSRQLH